MNPKALAPGEKLNNGRYIIRNTLGIGGFGITYLGFDTSLQIEVAIKEYFPATLASRNTTRRTHDTNRVRINDTQGEYQKGLEQFLGEARTIAKFNKLKGVVSVNNFFYENNTGYLIMEYLPGKSLKQLAQERQMPFSQSEVMATLNQVIQALHRVHQENIIHRDISPDNLVMDEDNVLTLVDFGSARNRLMGNQHYTIQLKYGYAPLEQYDSRGNQGPWTDVYSLCATIYYMMTLAVPPRATDRAISDNLRSLYDLGMDVSKEFSDVIMRGMSLDYKNRYQNMIQLGQALNSAPLPGSHYKGGWKEPPKQKPKKNDTDNEKQGSGAGSIILLIILAILLFIGSILTTVVVQNNRRMKEFEDESRTTIEYSIEIESEVDV